MLRHLLSSPSDDIGMVKPLEVEYKPGQEFVPVPSGYYTYPSTDYNYNILQPQPSVIQPTPYSTTTATLPYHIPVLDYANNNNNNNSTTAAAPTSTADLYSSTYAMLSADGITTQPEWSYPIPEKPVEYPPPPQQQQQQIQIQQPQFIHNLYPPAIPPPQQQQSTYHDPNALLYPYNYQIYYDSTSFPSTSAEPPPDCSNDAKKQLISGRSAQAAFSESFRKIAKIPKNEQNFEDDENGTERVMCLACKGVYTSRRSLTGHIGRNEKCREIIGRTYLDTLVQTGQSDILPDPNSLEGGISPICPNCNRFISHYKGNIRRHVNQCVKRPSKSSDSSSGQPSPNTVNSVAEHYAAMAPVITKDNPAYHHVMPECDDILHPFDHSSSFGGNPSSSTPTSSTAGTPSKKGTGKISAVAVQSTNPYSCSWCKFTTVYKGNMKRHLISVHNCTDEILRRISFDLERLRALATNRPVTPLAPQPEKIRGCSGRKRKCRPKNEKFDDSKRAKLLGENEIPPSAVSDVVASFASSNNNSINAVNNSNINSYPIIDEVLLPISSLDSGISSGSSIDEC